VRGVGVPTPPDDTLGTRFGKHQGPNRILPPPGCRPLGIALCPIDTAGTAWTYTGEADGRQRCVLDSRALRTRRRLRL
jgi:hypothetical protein